MSQVPHREPAPTPARPSTARAIARIWPYVKPYRWRLLGGMLAALGASVVALVIPYVLQALVDGPLASGDGSRIWPAGLGVLALGVLEAFFIASRRKMVMRPSTRIEASMRNALYAKLQDLPVAFHDRWESGQLLSRSVSDLSLIRRWLAFGIVLLVVNVVTIVIGFGVLFTFGWQLGLIFLVASIPVWVNSVLFERKYSVVARRSQDQVGDLATSVEQSVHGIRVLKAFGRGRYKLDEFAEQAEQLRGTEIEKAKAIAAIWFWLLLVPDVAFALCLLAGIWLASQGGAECRPAVRVLRDGDRAAVPDRVDRLLPVDDVRHPHRRGPVLRGHGLREHDHGPGVAEDDRRTPRGTRLQRDALPLPGLPGAVPRPGERRRAAAASRRDHGARRPHRLGQDDPAGARPAAVRRDRGDR
ncbi:ABC transporter ATP-binding protein [Curtobacterium sp. MCPF17_052]|nr:ABC transporter ATP-binding protein [Curtobacterium sp. MCPF17_052]WIB13632.1 ABC transporter ATP-binding protein [Curtobacterium sp. MCPF17_052]